MLSQFCLDIGSRGHVVFLGVVGLVLVFIGPLTMVAPDVPILKRHLQTTETVKQVERGRKKLFDTEKLLPDDPGYDVIANVLKNETNEPRDPAKIMAYKASSPYAKAYGGSEVYIIVEGDGNRHVGSGADIPEGEYEDINVGPSSLANQRISREIDRLQKHKFLKWGAPIFIGGFIAEFVAFLSLNVCLA